MNKNVDKIKNLLTQKHEDIEKFEFPESFQMLSPSDKQRLTRDFYNAISYFVHFIYQTPELRRNFLAMLKKLEDLMGNPRIMEIKKENYESIRKIVQKLSEKPIKLLLAGLTGEEKKVLNPFHKFDEPFAVDYLDYFTLVTDFKKYEEFRDPITGFGWIRNALLGLCQEVYKKNEKTGDSLMKKLRGEFDSLLQNIHELERIINYEPEFISLNSFKEVENIYRMVYPSSEGSIFYEFFKNASDFAEIRNNNEAKKLKKDVNKVYQFLLNSLDDKLNKHFIIERVKSFFELFIEPQDKKEEKQLQFEAEKLIFLEGYFPISEARLGSGRLDTLGVNFSDSILVEYKVIGGTTYKGNKIEVRRAINNAVTQIDSYRSKINSYPNLQKEVYILLFCYKYTEIVTENSFEGTPYFVKNGITYYLVPINILSMSPSEIQEKDKIILNLGN